MIDLLALKWRPRRFSELVGQQKAVSLLSKSVTLHRYFPCYLVSGPFGAGKTSIVRIFAKAVLCDAPLNGEPCDTCDSCLQFESHQNPNYVELDAASHGGVDDIRRLKDEALFQPFGGKLRKVVHLDEAGSITKSGNNAFLKLLEEGAASCVFILTTTDPDNILETVKSRSFEIELNKITTSDILSRLVYVADQESITYDQKALRLIASYSQGHMRDALMLLDQMRIMAPTISEETARQMLKIDARVEFLKLLHSIATSFEKTLEIIGQIELRLMPAEIWRGILEATLDCYLLFRNIPCDLDPVEIEWAKRVNEQGPTFLMSAMQMLQVLPHPRSMVETRFNLCQLSEKLGRKTAVTSSTQTSLHNLAKRQPAKSLENG